MTEPDPTPRPAAEPLSRPDRTAVWTQAREDYLAGDSACAVAERYGLSERTLHRRAALEGWRRADIDVRGLGDPPAWSRGLTKDQIIAFHPEMAEIDAARSDDAFQLLFNPEPHLLRNFAFRKAAEQAAIEAPRQALMWLRVLQAMDRSSDRLELDRNLFQPVDHLRAAFLRRFSQDVGAGLTDDQEVDEV